MKQEKNRQLIYTDLNDIIQYLELIGFIWPGKIKKDGKIVKATIEDFKDTVCLEVYDNFNTPAKYISVNVTDTSFELERLPADRKYNFDDYSPSWQNFMLKRKDKEYAKLIYSLILRIKNEKAKAFDNKIACLDKQLSDLKYQKNLEQAQYNTKLYNIEVNLTDKEIYELNKDI